VPADDLRLERALHDAAPVVDPAGVLGRVAHKRARRRRTRRLGTVAAALVVVVVIGTATVFVARGDDSSPNVAAPPAGLSARIVTGGDAAARGAAVTPRPVRLQPDVGVLVGPVYVGRTSVSVASRDRGTDIAPLTHVVRLDAANQIVDVENFKAEILSITEGEGARWALTRNPRAISKTDPSDAFLKRIGTVGDPTTVTLPPGSDPVGPIAAVGGAVWVPVRDGVLQFDAADGHYVRKLDLPPASARQVAQVGKAQAAYVTDGGTLRRLDPAGGLAQSVDFGPDVLGLASAGFTSEVLLRNEQGGTDRARVAGADSADPVRVTAVLPAGFRPDRLEASDTRLWVVGRVDQSPAIVLLSDEGVRSTVVLDHTSDATLAWTAEHTVTAAIDGTLFEIRAP
jgi:hypothetical protein